MSHAKKILIVSLLSLLIFQCTSEEDELDATLVGPLDIVSGGALLYKIGIDTQLTTTCGTAAAATSSSTSTTTESSSSSSSEASEVTQYTVSSYIQFMAGETLLMKFNYDEDEESFRMIPSSSTAQTCPTTDFVSCNGTDGINPTCETTDNISCGGADSFIFTSKLPEATFEANSGTIDWEEGFTINTEGSAVEFLDLEFTMVSTDGAIMSGTVRCVTD